MRETGLFASNKRKLMKEARQSKKKIERDQ